MRAIVLAPLALSACGALGGGGNQPSASDFVESDLPVTPGLASCLTTIGREDVAADPTADMSDAEIEALLDCTAERAAG